MLGKSQLNDVPLHRNGRYSTTKVSSRPSYPVSETVLSIHSTTVGTLLETTLRTRTQSPKTRRTRRRDLQEKLTYYSYVAIPIPSYYRMKSLKTRSKF